MTTQRSDEAERRFEDVFRHLDRVAAYARRRGASDPDDIAAEAMTIAWRRLADVPPDDPLPWILGVARNLVRARRRASTRTTVGLEGLPEVAARDQSEFGLDPELANALRALPEVDREALLLIAWEGLGPAQAAASLGISGVAFRVRLHRARRRCAALLERPNPTHPPREAPDGC